MPRLLNGFLLLCMLLAQSALAQENAQPTPVPVAAETPAVAEAPTAGIILIESSGESSEKLYQNVADALRSKGVKVLPGDDPIFNPVKLQAEIHAKPDTSTEMILEIIKHFKSLSIERFSISATPEDGENQIIIICPADISYRRVKSIKDAHIQPEVAKHFGFDVRVTGSNDPVTPVQVPTYDPNGKPPTYQEPYAPIPAPRETFVIPLEGKSKITHVPPIENRPTLKEVRPPAHTLPTPSPLKDDVQSFTTPANPHTPRYNPYRPGDPAIRNPQPVPYYAPGPSAKPKPIDLQVKIFRLQQADVASVGKIVEQLLGGDSNQSLTIVPDERTNSLIVRGSAEMLTQVEALVQKLDEPGSKTGITATVPAHGPAPLAYDFAERVGDDRIFTFSMGFARNEPSVSELRKQYQQLEQKAKEVATNPTVSFSDFNAVRKRETQLRPIVEQAFAARQRLQQAELTEFARRMQKIQQSIEQREKIQKQIIDRRVEELLNPAIEWNSPETNSSQVTKTTMPKAAVVYPYTTRRGPTDIDSKAANHNDYSLPRSASENLVLGKSPEEFRKLLSEQSRSVQVLHEQHLAQKQIVVDLLKQTNTPGNQQFYPEQLNSAQAAATQIEQQLQEALAKVALVVQEYEEQIKLLETVLQRDQTALTIAEESVLFAKRLQQKGYKSAGDLKQEELKLQDAAVAVQRNESLLKLYQQAGAGVVPVEKSLLPTTNSIIDPNRNEWLQRLAGSWNAKITNTTDKKSYVSTIHAEVSGTQIHFSDTDGSDESWFELRFVGTSKPQQLDLIPIISVEERDDLKQSGAPHEITFPAIIEETKEGVRICLQNDFTRERPKQFAANPESVLWELTRRETTEELNSTPAQDSPAAVLKLLQQYGDADDYKCFVGLLTDEEADRFAGMLLQSATIMSTVSQLVENASPNDPEIAKLSQINAIAMQHRRSDPSAEALAAYEGLSLRSLSGIFAQFGASSAAPPANTLSATEYSKQLRLSAGILKDPRAFSAEMMLVLSKMGSSEKSAIAKTPNWKIEITGDKAVATSDLEAARAIGTITSSTVELQKIEDQWWISSLMSDETILVFAQGGTVTDAESPIKSYSPPGEPVVAPSLPAAVPVKQVESLAVPESKPPKDAAPPKAAENIIRDLAGTWTPTEEARKFIDPDLLKNGDEADLKITVDAMLGDSLPKQGNWDKYLARLKTDFLGDPEWTPLATGLVGQPGESPETHHNFYVVLRNGAGKTVMHMGVVMGAKPEIELSGDSANQSLKLVWTEQDSSLSPLPLNLKSQKIEYRRLEEPAASPE